MRNSIFNQLTKDYATSTGQVCGCVWGSHREAGEEQKLVNHSPIHGDAIVQFHSASEQQVRRAVAATKTAFHDWQTVPAPRRGELVRRIGQLARQRKSQLAQLITLEVGKVVSEAEGEVQELIDICDFAVGLSRQLHGLTIASERPLHRMMEQWHPLGPIGIITAFNFPMAVWAWNAMLGLVCGDTLVWKPSEQAPLCALACHQLVEDAAQELPDLPANLSAIVLGERSCGEALAKHPDLRLISATGSVPMGRSVAQCVAARLGRSLLELSGNNAMIITPSADLNLAIPAAAFAAIGTSGQRCTSLRRAIIHESILSQVSKRLVNAYQSVIIGDPSQPETLMGPLINEAAFEGMQASLSSAQQQGGTLIYGGERIQGSVPKGGFYVRPAIVEIQADAKVLEQETFAPLLYLIPYQTLDEAIQINNQVSQGLSSALFSQNIQEAEAFLAATGSDCGIANINIGTSGAEIGGAFGGEKDTGGGRESGSDAWKNYMRRTTNTINYGNALPLAQGIRFDLS